MRVVQWLKPARKELGSFPQAVQERFKFALEIALPHRGDAYRAVYAVKIGNDIWVVHAFQKKSTEGIKTPRREIDIIHERLKRLKQELKP